MCGDYHSLILCVFALCFLSTLSQAQDTKEGLCDVNFDGLNSIIVDCSKRGFEHMPTDWSNEVNNINVTDKKVLMLFSNNSISNVTQLPSVSASHTAVKFKGNRIQYIEFSAFANVPNLYYIDFKSNELPAEALRSEVFQGPYANGRPGDLTVETLDFDYNRIHSLDKDLFQYTPNLTRLYLSHNPIEILDTVTILAISKATKLKTLELVNTGLSSIPLDAFKSLTQLEQLDLSRNKFVTVPDGVSVLGPSLESFIFSDNSIIELNDDSFIGLTNLKMLTVSNSGYLEEIRGSTFSPLKNLEVLYLNRNKNLRYISHNAFRGLKDNWTLKEVYLDDNNLSELPTDLMPWNKLSELGITGNNWLCNCDLYNIVSQLTFKFSSKNSPYCEAPLKWSGIAVTNITLEHCATFDTRFSKTTKGFFSCLKLKHMLWSVFGVAIVVFIGMVTGYLYKGAKKLYCKHIKPEPIRYINIHNSEVSFA